MAMSTESKKKMSELMRARVTEPGFAEKRNAAVRAVWNDPARRAAMLSKMQATRARKRAAKSTWQDPDFRARWHQARWGKTEQTAPEHRGFFQWLARGVGMMLGTTR